MQQGQRNWPFALANEVWHGRKSRKNRKNEFVTSRHVPYSVFLIHKTALGLSITEEITDDKRNLFQISRFSLEARSGGGFLRTTTEGSNKMNTALHSPADR